MDHHVVHEPLLLLVVLTVERVNKPLVVTIEIKPLRQYFLVVLFIQYVVLTLDKILC